MEICEFCGKECQTKRGLSLHLGKIHGIPKAIRWLSQDVVHEFFPSLHQRQWSDCETFIDELREKEVDQTVKGYLHALQGMVEGLRRDSNPPDPYIQEIKDSESKEIQKGHKEIKSILRKPVTTPFDQGYLQAWTSYLTYLKPKKQKM
ncbi:MAG: hypothetical protein ACOC6H_02490 [Thermoproteota archaeon]